MSFVYQHKTALGEVFIEEENDKIVSLYIHKEASGENKKTPLIEEVIKQLDEYLAGKRKLFDLPIEPKGTDFQKKIWQELIKIPYGTKISYKELATRAGSPKGFRAAGGACNKNPILLLIPCHRVVGANGSLVGFGAGLDTKEQLLRLEETGSLR